MVNQYANVRKEYLPHVLTKLNLSVCPYCNRHYIFTVDNGRKVSAQFDHFYSKMQYPYLALSFFNLIPCCPTCNKAKGERQIGLNPYIEGFDNNCTIHIDSPLNCILQKGDWSVQLVGDERSMANVEAFALDELYKRHKDYALDIVFKEIANEDGYLEVIEREFQRMGLSDNLTHRILWGCDINSEDMSKRPLSKMTIDLINQIKSLKG